MYSSYMPSNIPFYIPSYMPTPLPFSLLSTPPPPHMYLPPPPRMFSQVTFQLCELADESMVQALGATKRLTSCTNTDGWYPTAAMSKLRERFRQVIRHTSYDTYPLIYTPFVYHVYPLIYPLTHYLLYIIYLPPLISTIYPPIYTSTPLTYNYLSIYLPPPHTYIYPPSYTYIYPPPPGGRVEGI